VHTSFACSAFAFFLRFSFFCTEGNAASPTLDASSCGSAVACGSSLLARATTGAAKSQSYGINLVKEGRTGRTSSWCYWSILRALLLILATVLRSLQKRQVHEFGAEKRGSIRTHALRTLIERLLVFLRLRDALRVALPVPWTIERGRAVDAREGGMAAAVVCVQLWLLDRVLAA
jgi:hypothetical protein